MYKLSPVDLELINQPKISIAELAMIFGVNLPL